MKITTTINVYVERENGTSSVLSRTTVRTAGDNPRFERHEVQQAALDAVETFSEVNALGEARPL